MMAPFHLHKQTHDTFGSAYIVTDYVPESAIHLIIALMRVEV